MSLIYGLITGILFGVFLQRAKVLRYEKQISGLLLKDMTIFKFMLTAIIVASFGFYLFNDLGLIKLSIKGLSIGGQVLGGLLFGIGWGILGYCPGTASGAIGEGRIDALWGMLGMIIGGGLYGVIYPLFKPVIALGEYGKVTLPSVLNINHWVIIIPLAIVFFFIFKFFEKKDL